MAEFSRVNFQSVDGDELLTEDFLSFLLEAHDKFSARVTSIRKEREAMIGNAVSNI